MIKLSNCKECKHEGVCKFVDYISRIKDNAEMLQSIGSPKGFKIDIKIECGEVNNFSGGTVT